MAPVTLTRRRVLSVGLAAPFLVPARGLAAGRPLTIGLALSLTGPYAEEGREQLEAIDLAIGHLNGAGDGGMLATLSPSGLAGNGVLGRRVARVAADTRTSAARALEAARGMIARDGATAILGGSSSGAAVALQGLAAEAGVIFMAGVSHANAPTGRDRNAHGFRHFVNAHMSALALAPVLARLHGSARMAAHLSVDNEWGRSQQRAMRAVTEAIGWETIRAIPVPPETADFDAALDQATRGGGDVLILNLYGGSLLLALGAAARARLRDRGLEIVVPLHSDLVARRAGADIDGVVGTQNWHPALERDLGPRFAGTQAFVRAFEAAHGRVPGQAAQTCYAQTILYADAVSRAGSTAPCAVIEALADHAFDGLGTGPTLYRGADHQCLKDVAVVRGSRSGGHPLELLAVTGAEEVTYSPDHPDFAGRRIGACSGPA